MAISRVGLDEEAKRDGRAWDRHGAVRVEFSSEACSLMWCLRCPMTLGAARKAGLSCCLELQAACRWLPCCPILGADRDPSDKQSDLKEGVERENG